MEVPKVQFNNITGIPKNCKTKAIILTIARIIGMYFKVNNNVL